MYSYDQKNAIEYYMLKASTLVPSHSPFASPALLFTKKDYTLRLCVDYRRLNNLTIKNMYLIPRIDDFLDELFGALGFQRLILERGIIIMRSGE